MDQFNTEDQDLKIPLKRENLIFEDGRHYDLFQIFAEDNSVIGTSEVERFPRTPLLRGAHSVLQDEQKIEITIEADAGNFTDLSKLRFYYATKIMKLDSSGAPVDLTEEYPRDGEGKFDKAARNNDIDFVTWINSAAEAPIANVDISLGELIYFISKNYFYT